MKRLHVKWEHFITVGSSEQFESGEDVHEKLWEVKSSCC